MATKFDYLGIEKFAPHLIKKAAVIESGLATYHQVPNILTSNSYLLPVVKPEIKYYVGSNQSAAFNKNSSLNFSELPIGVDRLEINLEVNKDVVRDAVYSQVFGNLNGRRPEDLSEHEFSAEVLTYFGQLIKRQFLSDLDKFLLYGKDISGSHWFSLTAFGSFKMTGILGNAKKMPVSDVILLENGSGGVSLTDTEVPNTHGVSKHKISVTVPLATADLSFLKGKGRVTLYGYNNAVGNVFTANISAPYEVSGTNQTFELELYALSGLAINKLYIVKNTDIKAIMEAAASFAAELQEGGATGVRLYMNATELLRYNSVAYTNIAIPTDTVSSYQGFEIRVIPSLPDGVFVASQETCHVVSGVSASDLQGEDLQIFDLSMIGEKVYRARLSVMVGGASQEDYAAMFV